MVRNCKKELDGLWPQIVYIDLVGLSEQDACEELLEGLKRGRSKPKTAPAFPGAIQHNVAEEPLFPGKPGAVSGKKLSEEKPTLPRPKLDRSFNPYKTRDEWIGYITSSLQEAVEREAFLDFYADDVEGHKEIHILHNQNTIYSLNIYKGTMGRGGDDGISFSYAESRMIISNGVNAWGRFSWNAEKEAIVLDLMGSGMLSASFSADTKAYTREEFLQALWKKIQSVIERSAGG
jgi:hypothetical protein